MFESALLAHALDKETFKQLELTLRTELIDAELEVVERKSFPVLILITGLDAAGKSAVIHRLYEWMDPRHVTTNAYDDPDEAERARPRIWRYWRDLPGKGEFSVVAGESWYAHPLTRSLDGSLSREELEREIDVINGFEGVLAAEGALILKFLLLVTPKTQKKRLAAMLAGESNRHIIEGWTKAKWRKRAVPLVEEMLRRTSTPGAPWVVIPADDPEYRDASFGRTVLEAVRKRLAEAPRPTTPPVPVDVPLLDRKTVLSALDLSLTLGKDAYKRELKHWQKRLAALFDDPRFAKIAVVAVFEGNDAAGKGGAIRRVTAALDVRRLRIYPIAAPSEDEKAHAYLWRFWMRVPPLGKLAIFDRSWYGRVLVERVEGFAEEPAWQRAYGEINEFEAELTRAGIVVMKFWLATSADEQLKRFKEREATGYKRYKITAEDWRNREKWDAYAAAVGDMVDRTSTSYAPWTMVEAEDKRWARVKVVRTVCERIEAALDAL